MIAYEELQRALARWKARHSGTVDASDAAPDGHTPVGVAAAAGSYQAPDSTSELDLADADVDEAVDEA